MIFAWIVAGTVILLGAIFGLLPAAIYHLFRKGKYTNRWVKWTFSVISHTIFFVLGVRKHVTGIENLPAEGNGNRICYVANHTSILDIIGLPWALGIWTGFIGKAELQKVPVLNLYMDSMNCVYMKRGGIRSSIEAIAAGVDNINAGVPMLIFPEGTRSKNDKLSPFHPGSLKMATRSKAVISPIVIKSFRPACEGRKRGFIPVDVYIDVLPAIDTAVLSDEEIKALPERVESAINASYDSLPAVVY